MSSEEQEFVLPVKKTWIDVQKKTFTGWANSFLSERLMKIEDLECDLEDGVLLNNLLEEISGKKINHNKKPKMRIQMVENNKTAVDFVTSEGIKLVGIGAEDIVDKKLKLILGLIWTLILRYQIQQGIGDDSPKKALLDWVNKQIKPYGKQIKNFTNNWSDGTVLSALCDSLQPGVLLENRDLGGLSGDAFTDADKAMDVAQEAYEIPKILDPQDLVELPEELSVITYVSYFRDWLENKAEKEKQRLLRSAYPGHCYAYGPGLEGASTHEPAEFTIQAVNVYEDKLGHGGENFTVEITRDGTSDTVEATVTDKGDGTYPVSYTPSLPGEYTINVTLNGEPIKDMPAKLNIIGADASSTVAYGPGLEGANVGKPAEFKIEARDSNGEAVKGGGDEFEVTVTGPSDLGTQEVKDNGDGTYDVVYNPDKMGEYTVEVKLRGENIKDSPFTVLCQAGVASESYAEGPGLEDGNLTHHPCIFTIHAVDIDGNDSTQGGETFEVKINQGANEVDATVQDNDDGTYTVTYEVQSPGAYDVNVKLHDEDIKDMPKKVVIKPSPNAGQSWAEGPGLEEPNTHHDQVFTIHAVDHDGKDKTEGGDDFKVKIEGPEECEPKVEDNGDGTYTVTYNVEKAGDYNINVTYDDESIKDMPKQVTVSPSPFNEKSYAEGPGIETGKVFDNEATEFTIHAVDHEGNKLEKGGDEFNVKISGPRDVDVDVTDNGDGTYTVKYDPDEVGDYTIEVDYEGEPIKDAPFQVSVQEGTDPNNSTLDFSITVRAHDKRGNPKTFGGDKFDVKCVGGDANKVIIEGTDNGDGSYTANYTIGEGKFKISIKLNGRHIKGSPFRQNNNPKKKE